VLDWTGLSTHRPIAFSRVGEKAQGECTKALPVAPTRREEWNRRTCLLWQELRREDKARDSAARRLLLLKRAMTEVSIRMNRDTDKAPAKDSGDRLGCTVKALRALDKGRWDLFQDALREFPELNVHIDVENAPKEMAMLRRS